MFNNPFVQLLFAVSFVFALIVGYGVMLFIVLAAFIWPVTRMFKRTVNFFRNMARGRKPAEHVGWNPLFETFENANDQTQTMFPPPGVRSPEYAGHITNEKMPGLAWFSGRPIEAVHDKPDFIDAVTIMHDQM